ncbi:hypothetical protein [Halogeometricum limi]|uniref:Uncharacterized protein n=1 Tax=Halogeometricum limi TaxID=555875 RepID=A0A1I6IRW2_9EURY|nr:hypothetical protein [Halogeometricum limi]SFR69486.1 hypothetical protein SAMN04488124_3601 [Halogeometricum limi]
MLVRLHQYKHEAVQIDDNRTPGESQTADSIERDPEEYFGTELDVDAATWATVEYEDDPIQRREVTLDGVTAVSLPSDVGGSSDDPGLPGETVQVRHEGTIEEFENSRLVEATDSDPDEA